MIRCPYCGNDEDFAIDAVEYVTAYVHQIREDEDDADGEPGELEVTDTKGASGTEWDDASACRCLCCQYTAALTTFDAPAVPDAQVQCKFCHQHSLARTAHLHQGSWVGDTCCWTEQLRTTA
jgi:hypothetical protein